MGLSLCPVEGFNAPVVAAINGHFDPGRLRDDSDAYRRTKLGDNVIRRNPIERRGGIYISVDPAGAPAQRPSVESPEITRGISLRRSRANRVFGIKRKIELADAECTRHGTRSERNCRRQVMIVVAWRTRRCRECLVVDQD